ncbi:MAG: hypothetical protein ABEN55_15465 [Bradymonadaceae bacterium]
MADAIDEAEPRIDELEIAIVSVDPNEGRLELDIRFTPVDENQEYNRVYPLYRQKQV